MNITQTFYDHLATRYDKLFSDWQDATREQAVLLHGLFCKSGFDASVRVLDCACGIGTQAIGLGELGYHVTASDFSQGALNEAKQRAAKRKVDIAFHQADFRELHKVFSEQFDIIIAMDNALPHMLTAEDLALAIGSIMERVKDGGVFVASIRDYDALLKEQPPYSPPYIHKTPGGQRVAFQTWHWQGSCYRLVQYIIEDDADLTVSKFTCEYRATTREELTNLLMARGCKEVTWLFPEESGFYQPIVIAKK